MLAGGPHTATVGSETRSAARARHVNATSRPSVLQDLVPARRSRGLACARLAAGHGGAEIRHVRSSAVHTALRQEIAACRRAALGAPVTCGLPASGAELGQADVTVAVALCSSRQLPRYHQLTACWPGPRTRSPPRQEPAFPTGVWILRCILSTALAKLPPGCGRLCGVNDKV